MIEREQTPTRGFGEILKRDTNKLITKYGEKGKTYLKYFEFFYQDWPADLPEVRDEFDRLIKGEKRLDKSVMEKLAQRAGMVRENSAVSPQVRLARRVLHEFFHSEIADEFRKYDARLVYYGSIQYGDPHNLDADLLLLCRDVSLLQNEKLQDKLTEATDGLIDLWTRELVSITGKGEPHMSIFASGLYKNVEEAIKGQLGEFYDSLIDIAPALTGEAMFGQDRKWVREFQTELFEIIQADPLLVTYANENLRECLGVRRMRQNRG